MLNADLPTLTAAALLAWLVLMAIDRRDRQL
jgi:hypothetical protein